MFKKKHTNTSSNLKNKCYNTLIDDRTKIFISKNEEEVEDKSTFEERFINYLASYGEVRNEKERH